MSCNEQLCKTFDVVQGTSAKEAQAGKGYDQVSIYEKYFGADALQGVIEDDEANSSDDEKSSFSGLSKISEMSGQKDT